MTRIREGYQVLIDKLDEVNLALEGKCDDIDCNKYLYKDMLKKRYKPILEHSYSCITNLKRDRAAIMRLLSAKKFKPHRIKKCRVCKKPVDTLGKEHNLVSFIRPVIHNKKKAFEWKGATVHNRCGKRINVPEGWQKFN